jgi:hypothetical protein
MIELKKKNKIAKKRGKLLLYDKKIQNWFTIYLISKDKIKQNFMLKDEIKKKKKIKK